MLRVLVSEALSVRDLVSDALAVWVLVSDTLLVAVALRVKDAVVVCDAEDVRERDVERVVEAVFVRLAEAVNDFDVELERELEREDVLDRVTERLFVDERERVVERVVVPAGACVVVPEDAAEGKESGRRVARLPSQNELTACQAGRRRGRRGL